MKRLVPLVLLGVLAAGCSDASGRPGTLPPVGSEVSTAPSASATPLAAVSPQAMATPSSTDGSTPAAAPPSPGGAEDTALLRSSAAAFAREWMAALDRAYVSMRTEELAALSDPACRTCANYIAALNASREAGRKWVGGLHEVVSATAAPPQAGAVDVLVDFRATAAYVLEPDGSLTNEQPPLTATFEVRVEPRGGGLMAALRY